MPEGLKLVVSADVTQAEKALKDFVGEAATAGKQAGDALGKGLGKAGTAVNDIPKAVKPAQRAISHLGEDLETLRAKLAAKQSFVSVAKSTNEVVVLKGQIVELEKEIKRIESLGVPTFNNVSGAVKKAGFSFGSIVSGANNAYGVIRKIAFILPGIGIAGIFGAIFGLFSSGADEAEKKVDKLSDATDEANKKQEELSKAFDKAAGSVLNEAKEIEDLRRILLNTSQATIQLTQATVNQGVARFLFDEKNVQVQNLLNAGIQRELNLRKQAKPFSTVGEFRGATELQNLDKEIDRRQKLGVSVSDLIEKRKKLASIQQLEFTSEDEIGNINELSDGLDGFFKKFLDGSDKSKKATDDIIAEAKRLASFLNKNTQFQVAFEPDELKSEAENKKAARDFIQKARSFFEKNVSEFGVFDFKPLVRVEFDFIKDKSRFIRSVQNEATKTYDQSKKEFEDHIKQIAANNPIVVETNAKIKTAIERETQRGQADQNLFRSFGKNLFNFPDNPTGPDGKPLFTQMEQDARNAAAAINQTLSPAFDGLFAAIKAGENPLKAFFDGIGQQVEQLIEKLIAAAIQAAILSALFPGLGGGAKGFGGIFKSILGFAGGGIVSGPQLALIGEGIGTSKSNPEVVAPLDRLRGLLAGLAPQQSADGNLSATIRGNNILLSNNRTNRTNRRLGAR